MRFPDAAEPNDEQKRKLSELVYGALVEIRALERDGRHEQARAVADRFHNVPMLMWTPWFSFDRLRQQVHFYQERFSGTGHVNFAEWLAREDRPVSGESGIPT